ncbi:hypothetical protein ES703_73813 [subsurface metagenome]
MIELGIYQAKDGKEYQCRFFPDEEIAKAIGPFPESGQSRFLGPKFEVRAESKEKAKQKLAEKIGDLVG